MSEDIQNLYNLQFNPVPTTSEGGEQQLLRVDATGVPISGEKPWRAVFASIDDLLAALGSKLALPSVQLDAIRESLSSGQTTEIGGRVSGSTLLVGEEQLKNLGFVLRFPRLAEETAPEPQWGAGAPKGARAVFSRIIKEGANVPLFLGQTMINALRDLGYNDTTSAVCEHVDNSFQWGSQDVRLYFHEKGKKGDRRINVLIVDNGVGMSPNVLRAVTAFGGSLCYDNRETVGKYGMGMKAAALSIGPALEIYSWQEPGAIYRMILDTVDISNEKVNEVKLPEPEFLDKLPPEVREILVQPMTFPKKADEQELLADSDEALMERLGGSGTIVYIPDCDRLTFRTVKSLVEHATKEMARIYRRFLKDGRNLFINNRRIRPFDPTYRMEEAIHASIAELGEKKGRLVQSWTIAIPLEEDSTVTREITVRLFILPIEAWDQLGRKILRSDLRVFEDIGLSFVRNGREVHMGPLTAITGKMGTRDSWWRLEIDFPAALDEAMGVAVNKQGVRPKAYVSELIRREIQAELSNVKSRIDQHWSSRATEAAKAKIRAAEQRANEAETLQSTLLPQPEMTEEERKEYDKQLRALASELKRAEETDEEVYERIQKSKYVTEFRHDDDAPFYRVDHKLRKIILRINTAHPFFDALYKPLAQIAKRSADLRITGEEDEVALDTELVKSCADSLITLELMLLSLARTQSEMTLNDPDGATQRMLDRFRRQWSLNLLNQLSVH
jgi:hypothetical protein